MMPSLIETSNQGPGRAHTTRRVIDKSDWLAAQMCPAMGWFRLRTAPLPPSEADRFRMEQGQNVGRLAQELYQDGIFVSARAGRTAVDITQDFIAEGRVETLFEAAFKAGLFVARADILKRVEGGWHVLEVKSSFVDTDQIGALIEDLAYTVMVLRRTGLPVVRASMVLLSRSYRFGDEPERLFEVIHQTSEVEDRVAQAEASADNIASALFSEAPPVPVLVSACRGCDFFEDKCLGAGLDHTVLEIPGLHHTKLKRLSAEGIIDLSRLPHDFELNERQERSKFAALSGNTVIAPGLAKVLGKKVLPALVPELSYAGLDVRDGDTAIARFARMARGDISGDDVPVTRRQLLDYCKLDTYAMLRLHEALIGLAGARQTGAA